MMGKPRPGELDSWSSKSRRSDRPSRRLGYRLVTRRSYARITLMAVPTYRCVSGNPKQCRKFKSGLSVV
jgi:hypothetical protein